MNRGSRGLVLVYTGDGKGKTTAAFGLALRAAGRGFRVHVIQFIKGAMETGEIDLIAKALPSITVERVGKGFTWRRDVVPTFEDHVAAARDGLARAREAVTAGTYQVVILDEINVALKKKLLETNDVLDVLDRRPNELHLVLTGRGAPTELIDRADLVTEMRCVKHPFQRGIPAQIGIDR
ncbi:MAG: cob(I)yrinic acid a,c-diamide adenosyltransferase [Nitrospirae bacterium]|nr:cob(I)yrinic acid a,c-diamide adenosyltransferase [Nitrospirota bacterium]